MSKNIKILLFELAMIIGKSDFEYPIFIVYLLSRGLSDSEIALLFSIQAVTVFIFEYVTGIIADRIGSKSILIIGSLSMIMAEMLFLFSETLPSYTLAICFISFGVAAKSGADIASLHDLITHENINSTFEKEISGFMVMKTIWPIFAIIIGSNCFTYNNKLPFLLTIAANIISIISFGILLPGNVPCKRKSSAILISALKKSFSNKSMVFLLIIVCLVNPIYQFISNDIQANIKNTEFAIGSLGYIYIFMEIGEGIGSKLFYHFSKKFTNFKILKFAVLGMSICTFIIAAKMYLAVIIILGITYGVIATANIIEINAVADDYNRATMMSQQHAIIKISQTIFFATCTALLKIVDLNMVLCFSGIVLLIVFFTQKIVLKNAETV